MKALSTATQPLPKLTKKQQEILKLLYNHRFLNRIQIQALLKHKDYKRINVWLKYLRENNYVEWIYSTDFVEKTKPAIYYLGLNGIRYLRTLTVVDEDGKQVAGYPSEELHKRYGEAERSQTYIDRSLLIADCVLALERARTDDTWYYYETEAEYLMDSFYHFLADSEYAHPQLAFAKMTNGERSSNEPKTEKNYLLEIFDPTLPRYRIKKRLNDYIKFFSEGEWEAENNEDEPIPIVLFVCPRLTDLIYAKRRIRGLLADEWEKDDEDRPKIRFTMTEKLKEKGLVGEIFETSDSFITEGRPNIPGQLAHSGQIGLFGGHVEPNQTPYDTIRAELDQELGSHVMGPLQLIEAGYADSQNRHGEQVRRHVSLFHVSLDSVADLSMNVPGEIVHIPKTPGGVELYHDRLTPFAYQALLKAVTGI